MKHKKQRHGFSIVGVLVAAALTGGLALLISSVLNQSHKSQQYIFDRDSFLGAQSILKLIGNHTAWCRDAFRDAASNPLSLAPLLVNGDAVVDVAKIQMGTQVLLEKNAKVGAKFTIESLTLSGLGAATHIALPGSTDRLIPLVLAAQAKATGEIGGPSKTLRSEPLAMSFRVSAAGAILECEHAAPQVCPPGSVLMPDDDVPGATMCQPLSELLHLSGCTSGFLRGWNPDGSADCGQPPTGGLLPPLISTTLPKNPGVCVNTSQAAKNLSCDARCDAMGYDAGTAASCGGGVVSCSCSLPRIGGRAPLAATTILTDECAAVDAGEQATRCESLCRSKTYVNGAVTSCTARPPLSPTALRSTLACSCTD
jgi:hypothetical protein